MWQLKRRPAIEFPNLASLTSIPTAWSLLLTLKDQLYNSPGHQDREREVVLCPSCGCSTPKPLYSQPGSDPPAPVAVAVPEPRGE